MPVEHLHAFLRGEYKPEAGACAAFGHAVEPLPAGAFATEAPSDGMAPYIEKGDDILVVPYDVPKDPNCINAVVLAACGEELVIGSLYSLGNLATGKPTLCTAFRATWAHNVSGTVVDRVIGRIDRVTKTLDPKKMMAGCSPNAGAAVRS